jgi:hypothetical protein
MSAFSADGIVEPLDWDFTKFCGPEAKGTITEPTDRKIAEFNQAMRDEARKLRDTLPAIARNNEITPDNVFDTELDVSPDMFEERTKRSAAIYSALCSGHPTGGQIMKLPPRVRAVFYTWLQNEVMNPEAVTGDGTGVVRDLRPVAG